MNGDRAPSACCSWFLHAAHAATSPRILAVKRNTSNRPIAITTSIFIATMYLPACGALPRVSSPPYTCHERLSSSRQGSPFSQRSGNCSHLLLQLSHAPYLRFRNLSSFAEKYGGWRFRAPTVCNCRSWHKASTGWVISPLQHTADVANTLVQRTHFNGTCTVWS